MADIWFDVDAALSEVPVNIFPLTDDTDFKTRETGVAYNATGMDLVWNFVTTAGAYTQTAVTPTTGGAYDWAHQGDGMYSIEIPASGGASINNDTEGFGWFTGMATGVLPWRSPVFGFRAAGINNLLIDDAYSATRGLAGTALPAAAADAAGGLPISDAGALDLDAKLAHTEEVTAARMGALTDWIDGGRLDLLLDALLTRLTATRAGYLDNLSAGAVALASGVTVTTNNDKTGYTASTVSDKTGYSLSVTPPSASDIATAVWAAGSRTLSSFGSLVADVATAVWGAVARTITGGTITTNSDKTGYALTGTDIADIKAVTVKLDTAMELDGAVYRFTTNALEEAPSGTGGDATAANQTIIINHLTDVKGATFSGSTDSLEAIRNRGDAAWVTGAGLSGSNTALITIQDGSGNNIVGAFVDIYDSANTSFQQRYISDSSGQVSFTINDGTWYIRVIMSGYSFTASSFVVSGNYTHTFNMTPYVIGTPATSGLCRVYTYVFKPDGTTFSSVTASAVVSLVDKNDNNFYAGAVTGVYNTATGLLYFDIIQGGKANISISEVGLNRNILVPSETTKKLDDLE